MNSYQQSKKARYTVSIIYLLILTFLVGGTLLSEQNKSDSMSQQDKLTNLP